jgi:Putative Flp pilus-assembly TadE/G-like
MRHARHGERGQVFPLWVGAIVTTLMFGFLAMNYGNTLRYQIRAQNAADSVAQGIMAVQAQRFNALNVALYGTAVEEYRLRHLLDGVLLAANDPGGCQDMYADYLNTGSFKQGQCGQVYQDLSYAYIQSLNRYTLDVKFLNDYSSYASMAWFQSDAKSLVTHFTSSSKCNYAIDTTIQADGTDCLFQYTVVTPNGVPTSAPATQPLQGVEEDAQNIFIPGLNHTPPPNPLNAGNALAVTESALQFVPGAVDVTACAKIPPIVPNFGPIHLATQYAIGRAAAENVQIEEDWMQPGAVIDPLRGTGLNTLFQPLEAYTTFGGGVDGIAGTDTSEGYDWYDVDFGGNAATAYASYAVFNQPTYDNEFSVRMGWWDAIAIKPSLVDTAAPATSTICSAAPTPTGNNI